MKLITNIAFVLSILTITHLKAQLYEIPLDTKIQIAPLVVEGEVTESQSYFGEDGEIYTAHKIEIYQILKGINFDDDCLTIITMGGEVGEKAATWSHFLELENGQSGIFFLQPTNRPTIERTDYPMETFEVYSSSQGFLEYHDGKKETASDPFNRYGDIENQVFRKIEQMSGEKPKVIREDFSFRSGNTERCIIFSFEPLPQSGLNPIKIGADIKVRSVQGSFPLYQATVIFEYDTSFFGANMITNETLELFDGTISGLNVYNLTATDLASNKLEVKLSTVGNLSELFTVTEQKSHLARVYLDIQNPFGTANVTFDHDAMTQGNLYYDTTLAEAKPFDCIEIENEILPVVCPEIESFAPDTVAAGVGIESTNGTPGVVTITGDKFGTPNQGEFKPQNYRVGFRRIGGGWVYPPERDIISWTNTEIQVQVPSVGYNANGDFSISNHAGSGNIIVERTDMDSCFSEAGDLYIKFSARNSSSTFTSDGTRKSKLAKLSNRDDDGGYSIYFTQAFKDLQGAPNAFTRALNTWRCEVFVNFDIREQNEIPNADGACRVDFSETLPDGTLSTTVARTFRDVDACGDGDLTHVFLANFEMYFISRVKVNNNTIPIFWYTDEDAPNPELNFKDSLDLETIALHEIGHALLLNHVLNQGTVMYSPTKLTLRELEDDAKCGGVHCVDLSSVAPNCEGVMIKLTEDDCEIETNTIEVIKIEEVFNIYPNPSNEVLFLELKGNDGFIDVHKYLIYNPLGQLVLEKSGSNYTHHAQLNVSNLLEGYYFLRVELKDRNQILIGKFLKN
jgi:hypothetical protein